MLPVLPTLDLLTDLLDFPPKAVDSLLHLHGSECEVLLRLRLDREQLQTFLDLFESFLEVSNQQLQFAPVVRSDIGELLSEYLFDP